ncbi:MAG: LysM peptidoglycan-binding domain-containing protein, partial [Oscillospiraceae bacterium]|nr:LysM peptidoglycan-binding domain-containing protein [Oscillospiraceae bacterium]
AIVQELYDAWEKEHAAATGTGNELGIVTISEDGKTFTATYTVSSFSHFTVNSFTEAELPEIREFVTQPDGTLARAVNGQPVATHTVASGENLTTIARQYGCTVDEIVALNSDLIENPRLIFAGWVLTVPEK